MNLQPWKLLVLFGGLFVLAPATGSAQEAATKPAAEEATDTADEAAAEKTDQKADAKAEEKSAEDKPAEEPKTQQLLVNEKRLQLTVPTRWKVVKPRYNMIDMELSIPASDEKEKPAADPADEESQPPRGRVTMMAAGGDVDANIRRWVGQFRLGRDADGKDAMRRDRRRLRGAVAHVLDIAGTYFDSPQGPRGPKVELPDYRMLGVIIEVEGAGKYYVKFYGPAKIVEENREAFEEMLSSLEVVPEATEEPNPETETEES